MTGRLAGKVALVTGGTRGIGEAIVRVFAGEGAAVAFCGRRRDVGAALHAELEAAGLTTLYVDADVSREEDVKRLVAAVLDGFGRLDILVNNAGITASGPVEHTSVETWRDVMEHNLTSMFMVSREVIPLLRAAGGGSIINFGSTAGVVGFTNGAAYGVSKAAAIGFSRDLALELAPDGIRVNALCPGAIATPMNREWAEAQADPDAEQRALAARHPIGRIGTSEEAARAALFLASDDSSFVTGTALMVDGGYTAI